MDQDRGIRRPMQNGTVGNGHLHPRAQGHPAAVPPGVTALEARQSQGALPLQTAGGTGGGQSAFSRLWLKDPTRTRVRGSRPGRARVSEVSVPRRLRASGLRVGQTSGLGAGRREAAHRCQEAETPRASCLTPTPTLQPPTASVSRS